MTAMLVSSCLGMTTTSTPDTPAAFWARCAHALDIGRAVGKTVAHLLPAQLPANVTPAQGPRLRVSTKEPVFTEPTDSLFTTAHFMRFVSRLAERRVQLIGIFNCDVVVRSLFDSRDLGVKLVLDPQLIKLRMADTVPQAELVRVLADVAAQQSPRTTNIITNVIT